MSWGGYGAEPRTVPECQHSGLGSRSWPGWGGAGGSRETSGWRPASDCAALPNQPTPHTPLPTHSAPTVPVPPPRSAPLPQPSKQKRKFSSFFKSLVIELDKDLYGPDNHLVEVRPRPPLPLNLPPFHTPQSRQLHRFG